MLDVDSDISISGCESQDFNIDQINICKHFLPGKQTTVISLISLSDEKQIGKKLILTSVGRLD